MNANNYRQIHTQAHSHRNTQRRQSEICGAQLPATNTFILTVDNFTTLLTFNLYEQLHFMTIRAHSDCFVIARSLNLNLENTNRLSPQTHTIECGSAKVNAQINSNSYVIVFLLLLLRFFFICFFVVAVLNAEITYTWNAEPGRWSVDAMWQRKSPIELKNV